MEWQTEKNGEGNTTAYEYDELSRLLSHTTPEGNKTEYRYDALSRMTKAKDDPELYYLFEAVATLGGDKFDRVTWLDNNQGNI